MCISHHRRSFYRISLFLRFLFSLPKSVIPLWYTVSMSIALAIFANSVGAGANYLLSVLKSVDGSIPRPLPPWLSSTVSFADLVGSNK